MMVSRRPIAGNTATGWLKIIALLFMFIDHAGKMLFPQVLEMRLLGRIAFPLYAWCMVVGFHYTRSVPRYLLRILLIGVVSQPLYMLALNHTWTQPNIFLTLLLALAALWGVREKKGLSQVWAPALAMLLANALHCDYGWRGVALVLLLYMAQESRGGIAAVMIAFCIFWGSTSGGIVRLFGLPVTGLPGFIQPLLAPWLRVQALAILALPLMVIPFRRDVRLPAWLGYALYPAHLALLYALEKLL